MKTRCKSRFAFVALLILLLVSGQVPAAAGEETASPANAQGDAPAMALSPEPAGPPPSPEAAPSPTLSQKLLSAAPRSASLEQQTVGSTGAPVTLAPAKTSKKKKAWIIVGVVVGAAAVAAAASGGGSGSGGGIY